MTVFEKDSQSSRGKLLTTEFNDFFKETYTTLIVVAVYDKLTGVEDVYKSISNQKLKGHEWVSTFEKFETTTKQLSKGFWFLMVLILLSTLDEN